VSIAVVAFAFGGTSASAVAATVVATVVVAAVAVAVVVDVAASFVVAASQFADVAVGGESVAALAAVIFLPVH